MPENELTDLERNNESKTDDNSTKESTSNSGMSNQKSVLLQLTGNLPPRPNIIPKITGDTSIKDISGVIIDALTDLNLNLEAKTRLSPKEIMLFAKGMLEAVRYGPIDKNGFPSPNNVMWSYCLNRLKLAVSKGGKGRDDVINASKAISKLEADLRANEAKSIKV
jgi:hypothetical protein